MRRPGFIRAKKRRLSLGYNHSKATIPFIEIGVEVFERNIPEIQRILPKILIKGDTHAIRPVA